MRRDEHNDIDSLLEEVISQYSSRESPPGLEQRILNRVRRAPPVPRFAPSNWALAVPALVCVLLSVLFWIKRSPQSVPTPSPSLSAVPPQPTRIAAKVRPVRLAVAHTKPAKREPFPARAPLSEEERALLSLVRQVPEHAAEVLSTQPLFTGQPIGYPRVLIQELQVDDLTR